MLCKSAFVSRTNFFVTSDSKTVCSPSHVRILGTTQNCPVCDNLESYPRHPLRTPPPFTLCRYKSLQSLWEGARSRSRRLRMTETDQCKSMNPSSCALRNVSGRLRRVATRRAVRSCGSCCDTNCKDIDGMSPNSGDSCPLSLVVQSSLHIDC